VNLPFISTSATAGALHLQQQLTRAHLEQLTDDLTTRTIEICD
jgi:molecular chaperone DnaK (HSP70)